MAGLRRRTAPSRLTALPGRDSFFIGKQAGIVNEDILSGQDAKPRTQR
jgi:hypothetical protein